MRKTVAALAVGAVALLPLAAGCGSSLVGAAVAVGAVSGVDVQNYRGTEFVSEPREAGVPSWSVLKPEGWVASPPVAQLVGDVLVADEAWGSVEVPMRSMATLMSGSDLSPDIDAAEVFQMQLNSLNPALFRDVTSRQTSIGGYAALIIEAVNYGFDDAVFRSKSTVVVVPRVDGAGLAAIVLATVTPMGASAQEVADVEQFHNTIKIL